jgi:hypothetical protein
LPAEPVLCFVLLTCRDPSSDFRLPLVDALKKFGPCDYIWLRRRPVVTTHDGARREMSLVQFLAYIAGQKQNTEIPVYINSTNTSFPFSTLLLRFLAPRGIWCFDLHDDLRYSRRGVKCAYASFAMWLQQRFSDLTFHAAAKLGELFPDSRHLGNASHLVSLERRQDIRRQVLVLFSLDERFDFDLMRSVAQRCPDVVFDIDGQVSQNDPVIRHRLEKLIACCPNVRYHGAYTTEQLPNILLQYRVLFAPYRTDHLSTRYIDPLRFYHGLNTAMEVITTAIPQALAMQEHLWLIADADEFVTALKAITEQGESKRTGYVPVTWSQRAQELVKLIKSSLPISAISEGPERSH